MYKFGIIILVACCVGIQANDILEEIRDGVASLRAEVLQLRQENVELKKRLDVPTTYNVSAIGFLAVKTSAQNASDGDTIEWDMMLTNLGDGFNLVTNSFVCPVGGFYYFSFNLFNDGANNGQVCSATLVQDGANQVRGHSRIDGQDLITLTVSNSAFFLCAAGQRVSLQSDFDGNLVGAEQGRTSSFSGFLVFEYV